MEIYDFLEKYRDVKQTIYDDETYKSFEDSVYRKKEFYENRLSDKEEKIKKGSLMKHQKFMANFLSSYTLYDEILLFHEPGTGKTCTSISVIEKIKNETVNIDGAIIITRGDKFREQYINQLLFDCTQGQYIPENFDKLKDERTIKKAKKEKIKDYYQFYTFYEFSKKVSRMRESERQAEFSNKIIVIDEIHNIKFSDIEDKEEKEEKEDKQVKSTEEKEKEIKEIKSRKVTFKLDIYKTIHEVLHQVYNRKIILMSGTPMNDKPEEIADVMNLILPLSKQLPTGKEFIKEYFTKSSKSIDLTIKPEKIKKLKDILRGRISYLRFMKTDVKTEYTGEYNNGMTVFKTELCHMKSVQNETYKDTMTEEEQGKGVYLNARQCSLFVFPDNTYGSIGFGLNVEIKEKVKGMAKYELNSDIKNLFKGKSDEAKLKVLEEYSCKYASLIRNLLKPENKERLVFVYCNFVEGSGIVILCKLLELFGFNQNFGKVSKQGPNGSYGVITGNTPDKEISNVLSLFNNKDNRYGKNIRVLIGSETISEGINLKNIQDIYILTPYWNFTETKQAIARGIRTFSHNDLKEDGLNVTVNIHLLCSVPEREEEGEEREGEEEDKEEKEEKSIDLIMYKTSETKYKNIKLIENAIRESSVDCALNIRRNCDEVCSYSCDNIKELELKEDEIDYSSYLFRYTDLYKKLVFETLSETFSKQDFTDLNNIIQIIYTKIKKEKEIEENIQDIEDVKILVKIISIYIFELIDSSHLFVDKNGDKGFLNQQENILFLMKEKDSKNKGYSEYFYNENEYLKESIDTKETINKDYGNVYSLTILKYILNSKKFDSIILLPLINQELVLEYCLLSHVQNKDKNKDFVEFVMKHYSNFVTILNNTYISNLLFKDKNILRCLGSDKIWRNCNEDEIKSWLQEKEKKKDDKNVYGMSGIITKKGDFKIKFEEKDRFTGKTCTSYNMEELLPLLKKFNILPNIQTDLEFHYYIEELIFNICYMKEITRKKFFSKYDVDPSELELDDNEDVKEENEDKEDKLSKIIVYLVDKFFEGEEDKTDKKKIKFFKKELVKHIIKKRQEKDKLKKYELVRTYYEEEMKLFEGEEKEDKDDKEDKLIKYISSKDIKEILSMSFWSRQKKQSACDKIKTFFIDNNMISYD